jgi:hypothetical protein
MIVRFVSDRKAFFEYVDPTAFRAYFESFSEMDVQIRRPSGVYDADTYLDAFVPISKDSDAVASVARSVSADARKANYLINKMTKTVNDALMRRNDEVPDWVFVFVDDNVEGGMPHTHGRVVCLPFRWATRSSGTDIFVKTLIHERVHVLQRAFQKTARAVIDTRYGLRPVMSRSLLEDFIKSQLRSNPDMDGYVYSDGIVAVFKQNATSLGQIRLIRIFDRGLNEVRGGSGPVAETEHPFETLAYDIAADVVLHAVKE